MAFDPRIDAYIAKSGAFAQPILVHLREQIHAACPDVVETIKWSMPSFTLDGKILAHMAAFKAHCAFGFWKREAAADGGGDKGGEAMGQFGRIATLKDLPAKHELQAQIKKAVALARAGAVRTREPKAAKPPPQAPHDLLAALAENDDARRCFEGFPPSKQRDYVDWITEAKQESTRLKRLLQAVEWLAEGKSRNWKYENC